MITSVPPKALYESQKESHVRMKKKVKPSSQLRHLLHLRSETHDELQEVNLGSDEEPWPTFIDKYMSLEVKEAFLKF